MEYREFSAKTVDEAIIRAMEELETSSELLDYEVIEEGTSGFLGILGVRNAVIRARRRDLAEGSLFREEAPESKAEAKKAPEKKEAAKPAPVKEEAPAEAAAPKAPVNTEAEEEAAKNFLEGVFKAMEIPVEIYTAYDVEEENLCVELAGPDMGLLIGKRGQTLDSLQYLTSLVVNKGREEYLRVKLDTENYRERRRDTLENLARNISHKVKRTRRSVALEPMNPYERRIIHSALQSDRFVTTRSEGEEPFRHVVVFPKKADKEGKRRSEEA